MTRGDTAEGSPSERVPSAWDPLEGFHQRESTHQRGPTRGVPLEGVPHQTGVPSEWSLWSSPIRGGPIGEGPISPPHQLWEDPNPPRHTDIALSPQAAPSTQRVPVPISPPVPSPPRCPVSGAWGISLHPLPIRQHWGQLGTPLPAPISLHPPQFAGITHIHIPREPRGCRTAPWPYPSAAPHPTPLRVPLPLLSPCISLLPLALPALPGSG